MMRRSRLLDFALAAFLCGVLAASLVVDFGPGGDLALAGRDLGPGCLSRYLTGIECPFCGISHSLVALADGHLRASFAYHPLGPVAVVLFSAFILAVIATVRRQHGAVIESRAFSVLGSSLIVTSVVIWGARTVLG